MSGLTILGVCMFALVLGLRIAAWKARPIQSSPGDRLKLAKVLAVALLTFLAIAMRLSWTQNSLDGKARQPLTWWEEISERY